MPTQYIANQSYIIVSRCRDTFISHARAYAVHYLVSYLHFRYVRIVDIAYYY